MSIDDYVGYASAILNLHAKKKLEFPYVPSIMTTKGMGKTIILSGRSPQKAEFAAVAIVKVRMVNCLETVCKIRITYGSVEPVIEYIDDFKPKTVVY